MNCWSTKRRREDFVDNRLRPSERARIASHLTECQSCSLEFDQERAVRATLRRLPSPKLPAHLRVALRVKASQERSAVETHRGPRLIRLWEGWLYRIDELMRPLTNSRHRRAALQSHFVRRADLYYWHHHGLGEL